MNRTLVSCKEKAALSVSALVKVDSLTQLIKPLTIGVKTDNPALQLGASAQTRFGLGEFQLDGYPYIAKTN